VTHAEEKLRLRIGVLALQGDVREHLRALRRCGVDSEPIRWPSELAECDAVVMPGGESTAMVKVATAVDLWGPLRSRIAAGMPAYGSCAGMILLADHLTTDSVGSTASGGGVGGLDVVVHRNAFGRQADSFEIDLLMSGIGPPAVRGVFIRAPLVESVGAGVQVLARLPDGVPPGSSGTIVAVRQGGLLATSFHPELTGDHRVHQLFVDITRDALMATDGRSDHR
jgi:pyridoxal 5'-phosphate synthase pdxT subunit